jgi:hypothetical protein
MGSFASTCCVSNLAIEAGDKVKFLLLAKNPYNSDSNNTCYMHDIWVPRTLPITAEYNDYGSIEKWETGLAQELWMEGFQFDLIEKGTGDNSYHDVPIRKQSTRMGVIQAILSVQQILSQARIRLRVTKKSLLRPWKRHIQGWGLRAGNTTKKAFQPFKKLRDYSGPTT